MKNLLKVMFLFMALGLGFVSCSDDDEAATQGIGAETASAGIYRGTWTRVDQTTADTLMAEGTMALTADSAYISALTARCDGFALSYEVPVNIRWANDDILFECIYDTDGAIVESVIGAVSGTVSATDFSGFSGRISGSGVMTIADYTVSATVKSGRASTTYKYTFSFSGIKE